jgi:hypothetical protein
VGRSSRLLEAWPLAVEKCIYSHTRALPGCSAVGGAERRVLNAVCGTPCAERRGWQTHSFVDALPATQTRC